MCLLVVRRKGEGVKVVWCHVILSKMDWLILSNKRRCDDLTSGICISTYSFMEACQCNGECSCCASVARAPNNAAEQGVSELVTIFLCYILLTLAMHPDITSAPGNSLQSSRRTE